MARALAALLLAALAMAAAPATQPATRPATQPGFPTRTLTNGQVTLTIYLPDAENGFYRGSRFDGSGMIARAEYMGHAFFGPFRTPHDPLGNDHVVGTAEEFGMEQPLGWADAKPGETFLKIGVGRLVKDREPYAFGRHYTFAAPPEWTVTGGKEWAQFVQKEQSGRGHAYEYTKRITLRPDGFVIWRQLKNTGEEPIDTDHYGHNFIVIDDGPIGPDYRLAYPFDVRFRPEAKLGGIVQAAGREVRFTEPLAPGKAVWAPLMGEWKLTDNTVMVQNTRTGAVVKITGDLAPFKLVIYAESTAVCPEPFVRIQLKPGETRAWTTQYSLILGPAR